MTAYKELAKQSKQSMETQNKIAEYKLRVDRKLGDWSSKLEKKQGERSDLTSPEPGEVVSRKDYFKEIDISEGEMYRKEQIANIPEGKFEKYINTEKEITTSGAVKLGKELERNKRNELRIFLSKI